MQHVITLLLVLHIAAGTLALLSGVAAALLRKGGDGHVRSGRCYVWSMFVVSASALALASLRPSPFLFAIGLFSFYLVFTGWRAALRRDGRPQRIDMVATVTMLSTAGAMVLWGLRAWLPGQSGSDQSLVLLVFGALGFWLAVTDIGWLKRGGDKGKARIARHLGRMLGGLIATITAVAVVNLTFLPPLLVWLGPTVALTPLIFWWNRHLGTSARAPASRRQASG